MIGVYEGRGRSEKGEGGEGKRPGRILVVSTARKSSELSTQNLDISDDLPPF